MPQNALAEPAAQQVRRVVNPNDAMTVNGACVTMDWTGEKAMPTRVFLR